MFVFRRLLLFILLMSAPATMVRRVVVAVVVAKRGHVRARRRRRVHTMNLRFTPPRNREHEHEVATTNVRRPSPRRLGKPRMSGARFWTFFFFCFCSPSDDENVHENAFVTCHGRENNKNNKPFHRKILVRQLRINWTRSVGATVETRNDVASP